MIWGITLIAAPITSIIVSIILNEYYKKKLKQSLNDSLNDRLIKTYGISLGEWYKIQSKYPNSDYTKLHYYMSTSGPCCKKCNVKLCIHLEEVVVVSRCMSCDQ